MRAYRKRYRRPTPLDCFSADICLMVKEQIPLQHLFSIVVLGLGLGLGRPE